MKEHIDSETLSAYLDGCLETAQLDRVLNHIKVCVICAGEVNAYVKVRSVLKRTAIKNMPLDLAADLRLAAAKKFTEQPWWIQWRLPQYWVPATGMAISLLVWGWWMQKSFVSEDSIPLETVLAAHHRYLDEGNLPVTDLTADGFSARLASYEETVE